MKKIFLTIAAFALSATSANAAVTGGFGDKVENRVLTNEIEQLDKSKSDTVIFYTTITEQQGDTVTHIWKNGEEEIFKKSFPIKGQRWRVWSSMKPDHFAPGDTITVQVQDQNGKNIFEDSLGVVEANAPTPQKAPAEPKDMPVDNVPSTLDVD